MARHQAIARARKRKNADRSDGEDDSDFDYTHKQPLKLTSLQPSAKAQPKPKARSSRTQPQSSSSRSKKHQQQAVPSLSSSDRDSPSPVERTHASSRTRPVPNKDEGWKAELKDLQRSKRVTEEDRGFVFRRKTITTSTTAVDNSHSSTRTTSKSSSNGGTRQDKASKAINDNRQRLRDHTPERSSDAIVEIPMRETPMINKNKDLREGNRRSSFTMRGRRASSIGNGFNALPHPSVDSSTFFRHISAEQPSVIRMKQLMSWCARRCIDGQRNKSQTALKVAKQVEEETLSMLIRGDFSMSWLNRQEREPIRKVPKKPHLQNVKNLQKLKEYEEQIAKLQKEDEEWTNVISSFNTFHASLVDSGPPLPPGDDPIMVQSVFADDIDLDLLTADERSMWEKHCKDKAVAKSTTTSSKKALESNAKASSKEQNKWMVDMMSTLEKEVDSLQDILYGASRFDKVTKQYTDQVLEQIASAIDGRQRPGPMESIPAAPVLPLSTKGAAHATIAPAVSIAPSAPDSADDPRQILRALSRLSL
ncbi:kinetochore protein Mis13/DSN1 [Entomortierella parvispora]|uniref:Kinetochore protein Mis13/DSN1 n=1 Tax=Entomortierella parvispora TaxID=205924 RepID=A0A9P3H2Q9_9FUNG|nr:kinetochore protein Mis13/DSN1 [Entomortierella parvispora]